MDVSAAAGLSTLMSVQQTASQQQVKVQALANDQLEQQGAQLISLIEQTPASDATRGQNLDVRA